MKNKVMWMLSLGILFWVNVLWINVYAYNVWTPVQYMKQLFVTPNGESDANKATIKIDGTNWTISAKNIEVTWNVWIWITDPKAKLDVNWKILSNYVSIRPKNNSKEWWEIELQKSNWSYLNAYINNYADNFRIYSNGTTKLQVNLKDGSTNIAGNAKINGDIIANGNVEVWKDLIMKDGRKILYQNEANKLYAQKKANLPFSIIWKIGDYLKPDIKWSFKSPIVKWNQYFLQEGDGRIIWLREWFDGKKYGLFYSYFDKQNDKFVNTDIQYNLDTFKMKWEYPCKIIWQTQTSVTIKTCITNAAWNSIENGTYFIITSWNTLNPIDNNKHIKPLPSWVPTANGYSSKLYYFDSIDKIVYLAPMKFRVFNGNGSEINYVNNFTNTHTKTIFTYDAPNQTDGVWCTTWTYMIMCNHTTYAGIHRWDPFAFYVALDDSGNLIIQNTRSYRERRYWGNYKRWNFAANIKTRFSFKDNKLYYLNKMPLKFDLDNPNANKTNGVINWGSNSLIWRKNADISYLKKSKEVLMSVSGTYPDTTKDQWYKVWVNKNITPAEFIYNKWKLWDIFSEDKEGYEKMYHSIPYDASLLWKWLSKTYFVGKNKIYSYAYSYKYSPTWWEWKFRNTVSTLPNLNVSNNSLPIPLSTKPVDTSKMDFYAHRYASMYLNNTWKIRIIYVEDNKLKLYKEELNNGNGGVEIIWNIDPTYYNDTKNNILNESSIKSLINSGYSLYRYRIKPIIKKWNNIYFAWFFVFWKANWNKNEKWVDLWNSKVYFKLFKYNSNWTLSSYNNSTLYLEQDNAWLIWNRNHWLKIVSYMTSDGSKLMFYYDWIERARNAWANQFDYSIVYNMNNKSIISKKYANRQNYRRTSDFRPIGIHPDYGPYYISSPWESQYIYYDKKDYVGSSLDKKMLNVFTHLHFSKENKVLWVTPAKWFIIYTSSSEVYSNWMSAILKTEAYNLADILWLSNNELKDRTIYAYLDPDDITKLKFDLKKDPNRTYMIIIHTSDRWIASIKLLNGLVINSNKVTVNNLFVNNNIKMVDKKTWKIVMITIENWKLVVTEEKK